MQRKHPYSSQPKKAKVGAISKKVMATIFWDVYGYCLHWLEKTLPTCWGRCERAIKSKQPGKRMNGVLLHQDNTFAHKSVAAMAAVCNCGFELVDYTYPYYLDLAPFDYFLAPTWKKKKKDGKQYQTYGEVISAVEDVFFRVRMGVSTLWESKHCNTNGRGVWITGETML